MILLSSKIFVDCDLEGCTRRSPVIETEVVIDMSPMQIKKLPEGWSEHLGYHYCPEHSN